MHHIPIIIGHRGTPAVFPEHTAVGYERAIADGCDFVEPDVVATSDGVLLVRHEPILDSTTNIAEHPEFADRRREDGWYAQDFSWEELQRLRANERLPRLRQGSDAHSGKHPLLRLRDLVLLVDAAAEARGRDCGLVIELKWYARMLAEGFDFEKLLLQELEPVQGSRSLRSVRIESFEPDALERLREAKWLHDLNARLIVLVAAIPLEDEEGPQLCTDAGLDDAAERFHGVSVSAGLLTEDLVKRAHARGLELFTYTLRAENEFLPAQYAGMPDDYWRVIAATGVDAVFADDSGMARAAFAASES